MLKKWPSYNIRKRDRQKLHNRDIGDALVTEVEAFRSMKLCDLEFTRFAYQIMTEEAHRQGLQLMLIMYMSSFRSRSSLNPDDTLSGYRRETLATIFERFKNKNNYFMDKTRLAQVRS